MTNRSKQNKKGKTLRYLDLSFEGRQHGKRDVLNNGFRPHGGYRASDSSGKKRRENKHPLNRFSYQKQVDYQKQLQEDINKLFEEDNLQQYGTPSWTVDVSREPSHSDESALFSNKLLAASRIEQQFGPIKYTKAILHTNKCTPPPSRDGVQFYRPNRTHQYLTSTELKDASQTDVDVKLGRPTRTTLLRARQRCNSAPVNAYEVRREMQRKAEQRAGDRPSSAHSSVQELLTVPIPEGESLHSFLIGARYNRAHYLDAKSLTDLGVYMPRDNPLGCFVVARTSRVKEEEVPPTPPDSPASSDAEDEDYMSTPPQRGSPPPPPSATPQPPLVSKPVESKEAWMDQVNGGDGVITNQNESKTVDQVTETEKTEGKVHIMEELLNLDDGFNVKGLGLGNTRPRSGRPISGRSYFEPKASAPRNLPMVHVQGTAISRAQKPRDPIEQTSIANQPGPLRHSSSLRDLSEKVKLEDINVRKSFIAKPLEIPKLEKPKVIKVDKSFNVPSLASSIAGDAAGTDQQLGSSVNAADSCEQPIADIEQGRDVKVPTESKENSIDASPAAKDQAAQVKPLVADIKIPTQEVVDQEVRASVSEQETVLTVLGPLSKEQEPEKPSTPEPKEARPIIKTGSIGQDLSGAAKAKKSRVRFADEVAAEDEVEKQAQADGAKSEEEARSADTIAAGDAAGTQMHVNVSKPEEEVKSADAVASGDTGENMITVSVNTAEGDGTTAKAVVAGDSVETEVGASEAEDEVKFFITEDEDMPQNNGQVQIAIPSVDADYDDDDVTPPAAETASEEAVPSDREPSVGESAENVESKDQMDNSSATNV